MSKLIKENAPFLQLLSSSTISIDQMKALLSTASRGQVNALTEVTHNLIKGNIPLLPGHKKGLNRHTSSLRILGASKLSLKKRKAVLNPALVKALLQISTPVLKSLY